MGLRAFSAVPVITSLNTPVIYSSTGPIADSDNFITGVAASSNIILTLPLAGNGPRRLQFGKITPFNILPFTVTILCAGSDLIYGSVPGTDSGVTSVVLTRKGHYLVLNSSPGNTWLVFALMNS